MEALGLASKSDMRGVLQDLKASEVLNQEQCERISEEHSAEAKRLSAEGDRLSAESRRLSAESKRLSRESNRRTQEVTRHSEEARRSQEHADRMDRAMSPPPQCSSSTDEKESRPSVRGALGRMANAAASAVEEHFDAELDDKPIRIPKEDRYETIRERHRAMQSFAQQAASAPPPPTPTGLSGAMPSSNLSEPNHPVRRGSPHSSPFASQSVQAEPISPPENRRLTRTAGLATMERRGTSLDIQSQGRPSLQAARPPRRPQGNSLDIAQGRANSYQVAQISRQQLRRQASEQAVNRLIPTGPVVESVHDAEGQVLRRRVAFPWYYTASLQGGVALGVFVGVVTLGLVIRNTLYLQGPKAAASIGDIRTQLGTIRGILDTLVVLNADGGRQQPPPPT